MGVKSFLQNSGFVKFDEEAPAPTNGNGKPAVVEQAEPEHQAVSHSSSPVRTVSHKASVSIDEDMKKQIMADVDAATPADLATFYENVAAFEQISDDEGTRYKSAFIAFTKSTKKTVADILNAMQSRIDALDSSIETFQKESQNETAAIAKLRKQTDELDEQIAELQAKKQEVMVEAAGREKNLSDSQTSFMVTTDAIKSELADEQTKLTTYLPTDITSARTSKKKREA